MKWADKYIKEIKETGTTSFRPFGNSMSGKIESGQLVTVTKVETPQSVVKNDIVLCEVNGKQYLHLVKAVKNNRFLIGNNKGRINGEITFDKIYGKLVL